MGTIKLEPNKVTVLKLLSRNNSYCLSAFQSIIFELRKKDEYVNVIHSLCLVFQYKNIFEEQFLYTCFIHLLLRNPLHSNHFSTSSLPHLTVYLHYYVIQLHDVIEVYVSTNDLISSIFGIGDNFLNLLNIFFRCEIFFQN